MSDNLAIIEEVARTILGNPDLVLDPALAIAEVPKWDSFATVQIILMIENQEGIQFDTVDVANIKKVSDLVAMMDKLC